LLCLLSQVLDKTVLAETLGLRGWHLLVGRLLLPELAVELLNLLGDLLLFILEVAGVLPVILLERHLRLAHHHLELLLPRHVALIDHLLLLLDLSLNSRVGGLLVSQRKNEFVQSFVALEKALFGGVALFPGLGRILDLGLHLRHLVAQSLLGLRELLALFFDLPKIVLLPQNLRFQVKLRRVE
jgi:hypothetical protein